MSLCDTCKNKRDTWSEKLKNDGYNGCVILYDGKITTQSCARNIEADTIATGWILLGMATNEQLIVKNVTKCPYQNYEVSRY